MSEYHPIDPIIGKTFTSVTSTDDTVTFSNDEETYIMQHNQDCCESVYLEDVNGDLADLVGTPIVEATEETSGTNPPGVPVPDYQDSFTWTFYRIRTIKGTVVLRWYGSSNGYYSETVNVDKVRTQS